MPVCPAPEIHVLPFFLLSLLPEFSCSGRTALPQRVFIQLDLGFLRIKGDGFYVGSSVSVESQALCIDDTLSAQIEPQREIGRRGRISGADHSLTFDVEGNAKQARCAAG